MARKNYSDEFRRQAVDLYESTPGATVRGIADDLGIERGTLRHWLDQHGTGKKTAADGTVTGSPLTPRRPPEPADRARGEETFEDVRRHAAPGVGDRHLHRAGERRHARGDRDRAFARHFRRRSGSPDETCAPSCAPSAHVATVATPSR